MMRFGFLRFIQLLIIGMLAVFAGGGHPIAQTANQASSQSGQAGDQAKTQEARPPPPPLQNRLTKSRSHFRVTTTLFLPSRFRPMGSVWPARGIIPSRSRISKPAKNC